jgi:hypothetical protein
VRKMMTKRTDWALDRRKSLPYRPASRDAASAPG